MRSPFRIGTGNNRNTASLRGKVEHEGDSRIIAEIRHMIPTLLTTAGKSPFPSHFYCADRNVQSVTIEVNRALYMDESTGAKSSGFDEIRDGLSKILSTLSQVD